MENAPSDEAEKKLLAKAAVNRAADISFVIDRLTHPVRSAPAWTHWQMIDPRRVGAAGHSLGGNAAASVMATDQRVRAGVNLDGTFFAPVPVSGLGKRPFLMLGTKARTRPTPPGRGTGTASTSHCWTARPCQS